jgi:predicted RNA-binding Zn-ribbon protein involved in translation (DUF1610 family)
MTDEPTEKQTTKVCPECGNTHLALLRTLDQKVCTDCGKTIPWFLEPGQKQIN